MKTTVTTSKKALLLTALTRLSPSFLIIGVLMLTSGNCMAQQESRTYQLDWKWDAPIILAGAGLTAYNFSAISAKSGIDSLTLANLNINDVNKFDRSVAGNFDLDAEVASDALFFGAFPYGLVLLVDKAARQEAGAIGMMYLQAISLSSMSYSAAAGHIDRFRPYTYKKDELDNEELQSDRTSLHARNSFYAGHPSIVTTSTVFVAKVFHDLHPESNWRYLFWTVAGGASIGTAYLRVKAGKHFPTDAITGVAVSSAIGFLVPHLHKTASNDRALKVMPYSGESTGLYLTYTF